MKKPNTVAIEDGAKKKKSQPLPSKQTNIERIAANNPQVKPITSTPKVRRAVPMDTRKTTTPSGTASTYNSAVSNPSYTPPAAVTSYKPLSVKTNIERIKEYNPAPRRALKPLNAKTNIEQMTEYNPAPRVALKPLRVQTGEERVDHYIQTDDTAAQWRVMEDERRVRELPAAVDYATRNYGGYNHKSAEELLAYMQSQPTKQQDAFIRTMKEVQNNPNLKRGRTGMERNVEGAAIAAGEYYGLSPKEVGLMSAAEQESLMKNAYGAYLDEHPEIKFKDYSYEQLQDAIEDENRKNLQATGEAYEAGNEKISGMESMLFWAALNDGNIDAMVKGQEKLDEAYQAAAQAYYSAINVYDLYKAMNETASFYKPAGSYQQELMEAERNMMEAEKKMKQAARNADEAKYAYEKFLEQFYYNSREADAARAAQVYVGDKTLWDIIYYDEQIRLNMLHAELGDLTIAGQEEYQALVDAAKLEAAASSLDYDELMEFANRKHNEQDTLRAKRDAAEFALWNSALGAGASVLSRILGGSFGYFSAMGQSALNDWREPEDWRPIDYNNAAFRPTHIAMAMDEAIIEAVKRETAEYGIPAAGEILSNIYEIITERGVEAAADAIGSVVGAVAKNQAAGKAVSVLLKTGTASEKFLQAKEEGSSDSEAMNRVHTELMVNTLVDILASDEASVLFGKEFNEVGLDIFRDIVITYADALSSDSKTGIESVYESYVKMGYTEAEAYLLSAWDWIKDHGLSWWFNEAERDAYR